MTRMLLCMRRLCPPHPSQSTTGLDLEKLGVAILEKKDKVQKDDKVQEDDKVPREKRTSDVNLEATCGHMFP